MTSLDFYEKAIEVIREYVSNDWNLSMLHPPPKGILLLMRFENDTIPVIGYAEDFYPSHMWCLTGIGKHQLEPDDEDNSKAADVATLPDSGPTRDLSQGTGRRNNRKGRKNSVNRL